MLMFLHFTYVGILRATRFFLKTVLVMGSGTVVVFFQGSCFISLSVKIACVYFFSHMCLK